MSDLRPLGKEYAFTLAHFKAVKTLLYQFAGIKLADSKDAMVYSRLVRRIRALKLSGFTAYLEYLQANECEHQEFINALTTNQTAFFREPHHFEVLKRYLQTHPHTKRIWCAASSTGEEPYSIAMVVAEHFGRFNTPIEIIASDIDSAVLKKAQTGIYPIERIETVSDERKTLFFQRGKGAKLGQVRVIPELKQMLQFTRINLVDSFWSIKTPVDIIFCRNVMIYFDKATQEAILKHMVLSLTEEGLYIAGHSENFNMFPQILTPVGQTTYQAVKGKTSAKTEY
ncbi:MAG: chemotaxis protein CheR [Shewanella xiamenensis]|uniref:CheR family methyltransferase n=1 Tax=Shewanella TaxID=22 RepID=UPI0006DB97D1|nr:MULTISPECIES: CheR family methyltransferase [Shewanella]PZP34114.1 MAG: chemotaxis protein CheR [Shewanella oneidensis]ASF14527.1 chemotaxis protein CheR [Shewanella sp. FDAARGOS_354]KPN76776.1 chemotaxis protein CheR [Shewanella sp. Sh95]MCD8550289.1 chemotaxis protein CheR [Shewanella xiamenensis]MCD8557475.1 chemotaxis protein CheR [Shewanella xiamenensis]